MEKTYVVRRLTPLECERLQALPDFWTDIGEWTDGNGKKHKPSDTPRYKALGNGVCCPFWYQLLGNITNELIDSDEELGTEGEYTLGSLFDGIGSFPLLWAKHNGAHSARWASEIEPFPIAVTKFHFGDEDLGIEGDIEKYL